MSSDGRNKHEKGERGRRRKTGRNPSGPGEERAPVDSELFSLFSNELVTSLPRPLLLYDPDSTVIHANRLAAETLGFDPRGLSRDDVLRRIDRRPCRDLNDAACDLLPVGPLRGETVTNEYHCFRAADGNERTVILSAAPFRYRGEVIGAVSTWQDITGWARRLPLAATADGMPHGSDDDTTGGYVDSGALVENLFPAEPVAIAVLDTTMNYVRVNRSFEEITSTPAESIVGRNHFDLFPGQEAKRLFAQVTRTGRTVQARDDRRLFGTDRKHTPDLLHWNLFPTWSEEGEINGFLLTLLDATERGRAEHELRRARRELDRSRRLSGIGTLAATVAHELRNPLGVIKAAVYNLRRKNADPALDRHIDNIDKKIDESTTIIDHLLHYTRIPPPNLAEVHLAEVLAESVVSVKKRFRERPVKFHRRLRRLRDVRIEADRGQLGEVFMNILGNAVQSIEDEGEVRIDARTRGGEWAVVEISDNGIGIDERDIERVFEPFFTRKAKGTGLGLALSREIIDMHDGSIEVQSERARGTTVTVTLPVMRRK